jgi:hypothetical protein
MRAPWYSVGHSGAVGFGWIVTARMMRYPGPSVASCWQYQAMDDETTVFSLILDAIREQPRDEEERQP